MCDEKFHGHLEWMELASFDVECNGIPEEIDIDKLDNVLLAKCTLEYANFMFKRNAIISEAISKATE